MTKYHPKPPEDDPLPPAPPTPPSLDYERKPEPKAPLWPALLVIASLVAFTGLAFNWLTAETPVTPTAVASPTPSYTPTVITKEALDKKMNVVAFFLGRGQDFGATQVLKDFLGNSGCIVLYRGYQAFDTREEAEEANTNFRIQARPSFPGAMLSTGVAKADRPKVVGGRWIGSGVAVECP